MLFLRSTATTYLLVCLISKSFVPGDRGIFFLRRGARGTLVPHLRAQGLLKLDQSDRVRGSNVTLADVRRAAEQVR